MNKKFANAYGYFSENGREYVITTPITPRTWGNIISNGDYGLMVSQTGSGYSWAATPDKIGLPVLFKIWSKTTGANIFIFAT